MASFIKRGESIFIPFRDGQSISDSQMRPRMYKTIKTFEKSFPVHYLKKDGIELVEYAEVKQGEWMHLGGDEWCCSACGDVIHTEGSWEKPTKKYCSECGARMEGLHK